jgi:pyruvate-formate lyase-activating enzyme
MPTPSALLVAAGRARTPGLLPWPGVVDGVDPSVASVARAASQSDRAVWLGGGEPTLRRDLPALIAAVAESTGAPVGLDTDGLPLAQKGVAEGLARLGVGRLRIGLHCGRPDAHDWIVGQPGASRRARRAISAAADAGLEVSVRCLVTRPTTDWLEETVRLAVRLGAQAVDLVRLPAIGPAARKFITLSPRLGLAEPFLHAAVAAAKDAGIGVRLLGFPRCAVPRVPEALFGEEPLLLPDDPGLQALAAALALPPAAAACPSCPGGAACAGPAGDYVARFGRDEIDSERPGPPGVPHPQPPVFGSAPPPPPPRRGRTPATRLRFVRRQVSFPDLGGDPMAGEAPEPRERVATLAFDGTSRSARRAMARICQEGVGTLRLEGPGVFDHPDAEGLLRDALRLSLPRVEALGDVRPLAALSDRAVVGLRGLARVVATTPPDADPAEIDAVLARLARLAGLTVLRLDPGCEDAPPEER